MSHPDIRAALERLHEYAVAHPEHDTAELVAAACAALARWGRPTAPPAPPARPWAGRWDD